MKLSTSTLKINNLIIFGGLLHLLILHLPVLIFQAITWGTAYLCYSAIVTALYFCDSSISPVSISYQTDCIVQVPEDPILYALSFAVYTINTVALYSCFVNKTAVIAVVLGTLLASSGLILRFTAIHTLGKFFTTQFKVLKKQPLITTGVYSKIRHPSYTGMLMITLGIAILSNSYPAFMIWALLFVPLVVCRVKREEKILRQGFCEYPEYVRKTYHLVPFVY